MLTLTQDTLKTRAVGTPNTSQVLGLKKKRSAIEKSVTLDIPEQYRKWTPLFRNEKDARALPKHQPWDHEITL